MEGSVEGAVENATQNSHHHVTNRFDTIVATKRAELKEKKEKKEQERNDQMNLLYDEYKRLVLDEIIPWWENQVQEHWTDMSQDTSLKITIVTVSRNVRVDITCLDKWYRTFKSEQPRCVRQASGDDLLYVIEKCFTNIGFSCHIFLDKTYGDTIEVRRENN